MQGGSNFLSRVVIRPRLQNTSSSTFWVVPLSGHIIRAKTILPGAHGLNMWRDDVKENCRPQALRPRHTPSRVEPLNAANQTGPNNDEYVSHRKKNKRTWNIWEEAPRWVRSQNDGPQNREWLFLFLGLFKGPSEPQLALMLQSQEVNHMLRLVSFPTATSQSLFLPLTPNSGLCGAHLSNPSLMNSVWNILCFTPHWHLKGDDKKVAFLPVLLLT